MRGINNIKGEQQWAAWFLWYMWLHCSSCTSGHLLLPASSCAPMAAPYSRNIFQTIVSPSVWFLVNGIFRTGGGPRFPASTSFLSSPCIPLPERHLDSSFSLSSIPIIQEPYWQASGWGVLDLVLVTRVRMVSRLSQPQVVNSHKTSVPLCASFPHPEHDCQGAVHSLSVYQIKSIWLIWLSPSFPGTGCPVQ